jgi:hypothetical protein
MFQFEIIIMLVSIRTKPYFFENNLGCLCLNFFKFLFLLIKKLLVINYFTYWWICAGGYLYKIKFKLFSKLKSFSNRKYPGFTDIIAYEANFPGTDLIVYPKIRCVF